MGRRHHWMGLVWCCLLAGAATAGLAAQATQSKQFTISAERGARETLSFEVTTPGTITLEATWSSSGGAVNLALILNGPGQTGYYARKDGASPLSVEYTVTSQDVAKGKAWTATIANFSGRGPVAGTLKVAYPSSAAGAVGAVAARPAPAAARIIPMPPKVVGLASPAGALRPGVAPGLWVRLVIDSLYCVKESRWDHGTDSDEPYVMMIGMATHREPKAWPVGEGQVFGDVDSGENRRFTSQPRVIYEGPVPTDGVIGFHAVVWERDTCPGDTQTNVATRLAGNIANAMDSLSSVGGDVAGLPGRIVGAILGHLLGWWSGLLQEIVCFLGGGGDDKVAEASVAYGYNELLAWSREDQAGHPMVTDLDGGSEGHYWLRWHLEFVPGASRQFSARFTNWDEFAVGNVDGTAAAEVVIAIDEDAPGDNGRFYLYGADGRLARAFDAFYTSYDHIAVGNVTGDALAEIVVASDDRGGMVNVYNSRGAQLSSFSAPFTKYDGLAVGDVNGDGRGEILIARDDDRKVVVFNDRGAKLYEFGLNWSFSGVRNTHGTTRHDAFLVGDVLGDNRPEIVFLENRNSADSRIRIYTTDGGEATAPIRIGDLGGVFTHYDAAALVDLLGDGKKELAIAIDGGDGRVGHTNAIYDLARRRRLNTRHSPCFTKYDGWAAGDVLGTGKDQILLATDEDDLVYINM